MKEYYQHRAPNYDEVYAYPERQQDLLYLQQYLPLIFSGLDVLEVAAGTGYWTQFIARTANSILAIDAVATTLDELHKRNLTSVVNTRIEDAYSLSSITEKYNGAFAGLWFSHVLIERRAEFINVLHSKLTAGAKVVFIDNSEAQCQRLPITRNDTYGNTYQQRTLDSDRHYEVLKNFPTEKQLLELIDGLGEKANYQLLENFWLFEYQVKEGSY